MFKDSFIEQTWKIDEPFNFEIKNMRGYMIEMLDRSHQKKRDKIFDKKWRH